MTRRKTPSRPTSSDAGASDGRLLRAALDSLTQGAAVFGADRRLQAWNERFFDVLELQGDLRRPGTGLAELFRALTGRGDFGPGDADEAATREVERLFLPPDPAHLHLTPGGRVVERLLAPMADGGFVVTLTDATDRRRAELRLMESEERYALASAGANDGLWDWNLSTNRLYLSPRWKRMLGLAEDDVGDEPSEWLDRVHTDDLERLSAVLEGHLAGRSPHFESEHRLRRTDDSYLWVLARGLAVRDGFGRATRIAGSLTDVTDRKYQEAQALHNTLHDPLTQLPNRALFLDRVAQALFRARRAGSGRFAVLCLDLDRFKLVNDSLGHRLGDELLAAVGRRLAEIAGAGQTVARPGGDEFAVLIDEVAGPVEARALAERLLADLTKAFDIDGRRLVVTGSVGLALFDPAYERAEDMMRDAELAMYQAKSLGKARAELFHPSLHSHAVHLLTLENDLRQAIGRNELQLYFQPIIYLKTGRIAGFESLARWRHPRRGLLGPLEFITLAEETGQIGQIGAWVLEEACRRMRDWQARYPSDPALTISVNLSIRQFNQIDLVTEIVEILARSGWRAGKLKLELTETALMQNAARAAHILHQLKAADIAVSLDDFGTGYSSLSYLHALPFDTLKIDKSFIAGMVSDRSKLEIVRAILLLAHNLKMDVVAEGVETVEQLAQLRALDCEYAQGYLFAPPLDAEAAEQLLVENRKW
ncbi:MAG: EAL domain-containing protein [Alphaproteobacteria bacterium]|nr:EAL domain-containing protein [Alphaproteobacteria bacterium]